MFAKVTLPSQVTVHRGTTTTNVASASSVRTQEIFVGPALSGFVETDFLHVLFRTGVLQYFDAVSIHGYRFGRNSDNQSDRNAQWFCE